jgi:hypothetical protein
MNVKIGAEAALFPEKEYINGIAFAVQSPGMLLKRDMRITPSDSPPFKGMASCFENI